jgi:hypothetical protein
LASGKEVPTYIDTTLRFLAIVVLIEGVESRSARPTDRFVTFIQRLDSDCQRQLEESVRETNTASPMLMEEIAKYLYAIRCNFVHEGSLVNVLSDNRVLSLKRKGEPIVILTHLSLARFQEIFEHGVLLRFGYSGSRRHAAVEKRVPWR